MQTSPSYTDQEGYFENSESTVKNPKNAPTKTKPSNPATNPKPAKRAKEEDWVVPVKEDKSTTTKMENYSLQFDDLDFDQQNLLYVVYYIFRGHFDITVTLNADKDCGSSRSEKVSANRRA